MHIFISLCWVKWCNYHLYIFSSAIKMSLLLCITLYKTQDKKDLSYSGSGVEGETWRMEIRTPQSMFWDLTQESRREEQGEACQNICLTLCKGKREILILLLDFVSGELGLASSQGCLGNGSQRCLSYVSLIPSSSPALTVIPFGAQAGILVL
jgi:hypothetical protein